MRKTLAILLGALWCAFVSFAAPLPQDPDMKVGKLSNGLTYFIRHNDQTPGQADFYIAQRVGSILEEPEQRGLAHFLEHMAFNGTQHFNGGNGEANSIRNWCERNGIKFGADLNAYTSIEETVYNIANAPVTKSGVSDTCLLILHDWSHSLLLRDNEIDQERGVIREEWRTRRAARAIQRIMEEATPVVYAGSKYADCLPIGHLDIINNFAYQSLRDYYKKWYRPDLQAIIVVGDVNADEIEQKIKAIFSDIPAPAADAAERIYYTVPDNEEMILFTSTDDEQPTLNLSLYMKRDGVARNERATTERYAEGYKEELVSSMMQQRLKELTKVEHPKVVYANCYDGAFFLTDAKYAFNIMIGLLPDNPQAGIDAVMEIVEKVRAYGFTEAELQFAKEEMDMAIQTRLDNKDKTRNAEYVNKIVTHFCDAEDLMSIEQYSAIEKQCMQTVTLDDVNATAKRIISDPEKGGYNQVCIAYGPTKWNEQPYTMPTKEQLKGWLLAAEQKQYENTNVNKPIDRTLIKKLPKKGKILSKTEAEVGYTKYALSNGINVFVKPTQLEPKMVRLDMLRLGGSSLYEDKDVPSLKYLSNVIEMSGVADMDYMELERRCSGKNISVSPFITSEVEGVKGKCKTEDIKTWMEVMYLTLTQPRKDEAMFNSIIERQRTVLKNRAASPQVVFGDSLRITKYGNTPRTQPMTVERLKDVSLNRIYEIYNERFSDLAGMNLIITGDVDTKELEAMLKQYVASLPGITKNAKTPDCGPYRSRLQKGQRECIFQIDQKTPSALTGVVYSTPMPYTEMNIIKADVLAQIMRMVYTEKVREEKGGTYGVSVSADCNKRPEQDCRLTISFRCDPDKYAELLPIIHEQLQLMAEQGPTAEQLDKVKGYEQKNYDRIILTNGYWEGVISNLITDGINIDKDYMKLINSLTPQDIQDICRQIIASGNRILVTMK